MYPTITNLEKCQQLLSKTIKSSDNKKEVKLLFSTDKKGEFIITNRWNKTKRWRFYLVPKQDDWFIEFIFENEFIGLCI
jgi:hypothetical protein